MEDTRKRNMERRRETSRFAARDRRGKEADIFIDLKDVVPVVNEPTITHVDRIALLRVASTLCRLRKKAGNALQTWSTRPGRKEKAEDSPWLEETLSECLDGFVFLADSDGTILYVSESVSLFLGLTQTDLAGRFLRDFAHHSDYDELFRVGTELANSAGEDNDTRSLSIRLKSVISPRGRNLNLKSAVYKPVAFTVRSIKPVSGSAALLLHGCAIPAGQGSVNTAANALSKGMDTSFGTFMTRHTCDMRISYVSEALNALLRSESRSLMGASFYDLIHPADIQLFAKGVRELLDKGHTRTPYYRIIAKNGRFAWILTEATTITHTTRGQKGQYIICIHHLLGMQSEEESLVVSSDANPAGIRVNIKSEIIEEREPEELGRQPAVIDCVDFTPLFDESDQPFQTVGARRDSSMANRKSSYEEVLQWLFRDQPEDAAESPRRFLQPGELDEWRFLGSAGGGASRVCVQQREQQPLPLPSAPPGRPPRAFPPGPPSDSRRCSLTLPAQSCPPYPSQGTPAYPDRLSPGFPLRTAPSGGRCRPSFSSPGAHTLSISDTGVGEERRRRVCEGGRGERSIAGEEGPCMLASLSAAHPSPSLMTLPSQQQHPLLPNHNPHHSIYDTEPRQEQQHAALAENCFVEGAAPCPEETNAELCSLAPYLGSDDMQAIGADPMDLCSFFPDLPEWSPADPLPLFAGPVSNPLAVSPEIPKGYNINALLDDWPELDDDGLYSN